MNSVRTLFAVAAAFLFIAVVGSSKSVAEEGQPVAIRHWPGGGVTVETMWGLRVGVGLDPKSKLAVVVDLVDSEIEDKQVCVVHRKPNSDLATIETQGKLRRNGILVRRASFSLAPQGVTQSLPWTTVETDGVKICVLDAMPSKSEQASLVLAKSKEKFENPDVVVAIGKQFDRESSAQLIKVFKPRMMIVNADFQELGGIDVEALSHNTLACSSTVADGMKLFSLGTEPYKMSDELADLFTKKEASQKKSREMFAKLSVEQMNFKPANGSHTPRWNTEHMMGRELGFFSQIYNAVDPTIPVMDLNPKQMPKDYKFAHEDWTGEEEARQMKRVENFTRRFAYLLDGMDLDKRAPGSRIWTPRKLLKQMERHYNEHSANVVKKMKLDGWPKD